MGVLSRGIFYGSSIALAIHSLDPSLISRLIVVHSVDLLQGMVGRYIYRAPTGVTIEGRHGGRPLQKARPGEGSLSSSLSTRLISYGDGGQGSLWEFYQDLLWKLYGICYRARYSLA